MEDQKRIGADVMWLADSLHNLNTLGRAVRGDSSSEVVAVCDDLSRRFKNYTESHPGEYKSESMETFLRYGKAFKLETGITILEAIKAKMNQHQERVGKVGREFMRKAERCLK